MLTPTSRKPFQVHLPTAIVLMFVAGGLLWANFIPHKLEDQQFVTFFNWFEGPNCFMDGTSYGWPLAAKLRYVSIIGYFSEYSASRIAINAFIALILLASTWFISEWSIRRVALEKEV